MRIESGWDVPTLEEAETAIKLSLCGLVLLENNKIIGMARVLGDGVLCAFIQDVIIAKSHRRRHFGRKIMVSLIEYMQDNYASNCTIGLMAAKGKVGFYESFGFMARPSETTDAGMTAPLHSLISTSLVIQSKNS